ncbi:MAG: 5-formyltetrahydrofolate cyclo-ligase [Prochlorococcus sp.]
MNASASARKSEQRRRFRSLRSEQLPLVETRIVEKVQTTLLERFNQTVPGLHVGLFWPLPGEPDLRPLREQLPLSFALPACAEAGALHYHPWSSHPLSKDPCGIPAPLDEPKLAAESLGLLLIPALAVDLQGIRLGYGGGFYDRLRSLPSWKRVLALAVLPQACVSEQPLPRETWDVALDGWITEKGLSLL